MEFTKEERISIGSILISYRQEPAAHWKEATDEIQAVLAHRMEAPAKNGPCSVCGDSDGKGYCPIHRPEAPAPRVEQVAPLLDVQWDEQASASERTFTAEQIKQVREAILTQGDTPGGWPAFADAVCNRLDPPKTPEERVAVILQRNLDSTNPVSYYLPVAAEIVAELAKEGK